MTIKEAILKSLNDLKRTANHWDIYKHIISKNYYDFKKAKTPESTISAQLGEFIRNNDTRVKRIKGESGTFLYYLSKYEQELDLNTNIVESTSKKFTEQNNIKYNERDLHKLLATYLSSKQIFAKTIFHEQSKNNNDNHQKWIHPDMLGISFLNLQTKSTSLLLKALNIKDIFKITSYEIKKEIKTDYDLKKSYFQTVSNSSWSNFGYLVAFEINSSLMDEMERLNQSFGIGIIELKSNPYESKILFQSKYKELDFKTIDKLCKVNSDFDKFMIYIEKILTADEKYIDASQKELEDFCDKYFINDSEIEEYCKNKNIPFGIAN